MKTSLRHRYAALLSDRAFVKSVAWGFLFLVASLVINYFAALYALDRASNPVTDIILSNIPVFDVDQLFIWGPLVFWAVMAGLILREPRRIPFALKSIALFTVIRSMFISLTHIGPFPDQVAMDAFGSGWLQHLASNANFFIFSSGADLFFSGHTGLPFLMGLIFWNHRNIRTFCFASSVFFAVVVLLGHLHYSIDVASAFFITYAIFHIALQLFKADAHRFGILA